jgi:Ser/Thr protein kinase RdoA (MazF antagonist)
VTLLAERENRVYRLDSEGLAPSVLRVHRQDFRSDKEVESELQWMAHLSQEGLTVPVPFPSKDGALIQELDGYQINILTWLNGAPLGETGQPLDIKDRVGTFRKIGVTMARLHQISDDWQLPANFTRQHWNHDGLLGEQALWGRFWENPQLSSHQRDMISEARRKASEELVYKAETLDYGLIHADMVRENILLSEGSIQLLDFDDGGFGFRLFDVATALFKNRSEPDYPELEQALMEGYRSVRSLDMQELRLFTLLRSFTYVGWIISRMDENGSCQRAERFIETASELAEEYLAL